MWATNTFLTENNAMHRLSDNQLKFELVLDSSQHIKGKPSTRYNVAMGEVYEMHLWAALWGMRQSACTDNRGRDGWTSHSAREYFIERVASWAEKDDLLAYCTAGYEEDEKGLKPIERSPSQAAELDAVNPFCHYATLGIAVRPDDGRNTAKVLWGASLCMTSIWLSRMRYDPQKISLCNTELIHPKIKRYGQPAARHIAAYQQRFEKALGVFFGTEAVVLLLQLTSLRVVFITSPKEPHEPLQLRPAYVQRILGPLPFLKHLGYDRIPSNVHNMAPRKHQTKPNPPIDPKQSRAVPYALAYPFRCTNQWEAPHLKFEFKDVHLTSGNSPCLLYTSPSPRDA